MEINPQIFKAYDIRGIYPKEINPEVSYLIGRAFVKFLGKKGLKIVVGRDNRLSSPSLFRALIRGITDEGADVIDIGLSTTPMLYFAAVYYGFDGGIEITASHLSSEYNGFKIVREKAIPLSEKTGLNEIKKIVQKFSEKLPPEKKKIRKTGKKEILSKYINFNLQSIKTDIFKNLKIMADTANSISGLPAAELFERIPCKSCHLFKKLDGNFPNHPPDPLIKENLKFLILKVKQKKADLGIAFDGDGDRIIFVDEKGKIVPGDFITALVAEIILRENPGSKILYDVRSSRIVREVIKKGKGIPIQSRIGHSFIKEKMRRKNIIFGGEFSGHYYSKDHYFCEAPLFVLLKILEEISKSKKSLSQLIKPYRKYFHSGEINFKVKEREKVLTKLEKKYRKGKISHLDGLRVDFKDWWFNLRPSRTEPLLRLVLEAKTKKLMEEKKKELLFFIKKGSR